MLIQYFVRKLHGGFVTQAKSVEGGKIPSNQCESGHIIHHQFINCGFHFFGGYFAILNNLKLFEAGPVKKSPSQSTDIVNCIFWGAVTNV